MPHTIGEMSHLLKTKYSAAFERFQGDKGSASGPWQTSTSLLQLRVEGQAFPFLGYFGAWIYLFSGKKMPLAGNNRP